MHSRSAPLRGTAAAFLLPVLLLTGCGPSAEDQAAESFGQFARAWVAEQFPGEPVLKESAREHARGDEASYDVVKAYYRRQTVFEGLRTHVLVPTHKDQPFVGVLRGERVEQSTLPHATAEAAEQDNAFDGARFAYPEEHAFEYVHGRWQPRQPRTAASSSSRR